MQIQEQPGTIFDDYEPTEIKKSYPNLLQAWLWVPALLIINFLFGIVQALVFQFFWKVAAIPAIISFSVITICSEITFLLLSYYVLKLRSETHYRPSFRLPATKTESLSPPF
jgi:uncharacterized membrane-anchored protein